MFRSALGLSSRVRPFFTARDEDAHYLHLVDEKRDYARYQLAIAHGLQAISGWILFWPFLYVILGAGLLVIRWRDRLVRALLLSAFCYEAALLIVAPGGHEWRYSHWLATCVVIAAAIRLLDLPDRNGRLTPPAAAPDAPAAPRDRRAAPPRTAPSGRR